jgi:hypothetical protein
VPEPDPRLIIWTDHALAKAQLLGISRADVEEAILAGQGFASSTPPIGMSLAWSTGRQAAPCLATSCACFPRRPSASLHNFPAPAIPKFIGATFNSGGGRIRTFEA